MCESNVSHEKRRRRASPSATALQISLVPNAKLNGYPFGYQNGQSKPACPAPENSPLLVLMAYIRQRVSDTYSFDWHGGTSTRKTEVFLPLPRFIWRAPFS